MLLTALGELATDALLHRFDPSTGTLGGASTSERRLSDLRGCFADDGAYGAALIQGDPIVYTVATWSDDRSEGALSFGLGTLQVGRVGDEYFLTRGHYHAWRPAAEVYVGLYGRGGLVLENEDGAARFLPLAAGEVAYVPGSTAHRTVNTGDEPFTYLGVYAASAGHDYGSIADSNFQLVVIAGPDGPAAIKRADYRGNRSALLHKEAQV